MIISSVTYLYMSSYKKNICYPIRIEKRDNLGKIGAKEMGKFSLHDITHHGHIANGKISISLVMATFKYSYFSYYLFDFSQTFNDVLF